MLYPTFIPTIIATEATETYVLNVQFDPFCLWSDHHPVLKAFS